MMRTAGETPGGPQPLRASGLLLHSKLSNARHLSLQVLSVFSPSGKGIGKQPPGSVGDISAITTPLSNNTIVFLPAAVLRPCILLVEGILEMELALGEATGLLQRLLCKRCPHFSLDIY